MYHVLSVFRVDHQILYQRNIQQESCPRLCRKYKTVDISIMTGTEVPAMGHDSHGKQTTVEALPQIIEHYQSLGYTFKALDRDSFVAHHGVNN